MTWNTDKLGSAVLVSTSAAPADPPSLVSGTDILKCTVVSNVAIGNMNDSGWTLQTSGSAGGWNSKTWTKPYAGVASAVNVPCTGGTAGVARITAASSTLGTPTVVTATTCLDTNATSLAFSGAGSSITAATGDHALFDITMRTTAATYTANHTSDAISGGSTWSLTALSRGRTSYAGTANQVAYGVSKAEITTGGTGVPTYTATGVGSGANAAGLVDVVVFREPTAGTDYAKTPGDNAGGADAGAPVQAMDRIAGPGTIRLSHHGDSLTEQNDSGAAVSALYGSMGIAVRNVTAVVGRTIVAAGGGNTPSTETAIATERAGGHRANFWVIALISNDYGRTSTQWKQDIVTLLNILDDDGPCVVLWVGPAYGNGPNGTVTTQTPQMYTALNAVANRTDGTYNAPANIDMRVFDLNSVISKDPIYWDQSDSTGRHMTAAGYSLRNQLVSAFVAQNLPPDLFGGDRAGGTDSAAALLTTGRAPSDLGAGTDLAAMVREFTLNDSASASDTDNPYQLAWNEGVDDAVGATDVATIVRGANPVETLAGSDAAATVQDVVRSAADPAGATDVASRPLDAVRTGSDNAGATDSAVRLVDLARAPAEALAGSDVASSLQDNVRAPGDSAGGTDSASSVEDFPRLPVDSGAAFDSTAPVLDRIRSFDDAAAAQDLVDVQLQSATGQIVNDTGYGTDLVETEMNREVTITEPSTGTDWASRPLGVVRSAVDPAGATDAATLVRGWGLTFGDSAAGTDSASSGDRNVDEMPSDTAGVLDSIRVERGIGRNDTGAVSDDAGFEAELDVLLEDLAAAVDEAIGGKEIERLIAESVGATDAATTKAPATTGYVLAGSRSGPFVTRGT